MISTGVFGVVIVTVIYGAIVVGYGIKMVLDQTYTKHKKYKAYKNY